VAARNQAAQIGYCSSVASLLTATHKEEGIARMKTPQQLQQQPKETDQQIEESTRRKRELELLANQQRQLKQLKGEEEAAAAFERAASELLGAVDSTIAAIRQGKEETRSILDRLEVRLASSHG
jgi:hypothetical protein